MAKREILILSSWYPTKHHPFLGNFVARNAQLLNQHYNVTVINTIPSDTISKLSLKDEQNLGYREIQVTHPRGKYGYSKHYWQKKALKQAFLEINRIDLVIGHILLPKALQFTLAKKKFKAPLILVEHGSYYRAELRKKWHYLHEIMLRYTRKKISEVVAVSSFLVQNIKHDFPKHDIKVIGNHIDTSTFILGEHKPSKRTNFLHISTLDPSTKNPQGILDACKLLHENKIDFHLTIVCDEDYSKWEEIVVSKGLREHIHFAGPLEWTDLVPFYQQSDAFILNSDYESFSIVLAEAWATGTPVISPPVGIAHELNPELGIQTKKNNSESLKTAMQTMIETKFNYSQHQLREHAMQFSEQAILNQWTQLIDKYVK
ncbi:MAG: glycosyltransferase [Crocinitomicaceae bacterium]|nr:glycosyltransferase [Crocinitomicaceae bacterium]MDG1776916.1 glycosyltransferase [Crocinitomicaceae bacterium]